MRDAFLPLIPPATQAASTVGVPLDLLAGTNVQKDGRAGTDLLGRYGNMNNIAAEITVSQLGGTNTPAVQFTLNQSDDNAAYVPVGSVTATTNGDYQIPLLGVTKRYLRLDTTLTGTAPTAAIDAYVGTIAF